MFNLSKYALGAIIGMVIVLLAIAISTSALTSRLDRIAESLNKEADRNERDALKKRLNKVEDALGELVNENINELVKSTAADARKNDRAFALLALKAEARFRLDGLSTWTVFNRYDESGVEQFIPKIIDEERGSVFDFSSGASTIRTGKLAVGGASTFVAWVKLPHDDVSCDFVRWSGPLEKGDAIVSADYRLQIQDSRMVDFLLEEQAGFTLWNFAQSDTPNIASIDKWHHLVVRFTRDSAEVWVDGEKLRSTDLQYPININGAEVTIGQDFTGRLDDFAIFDRTLTEDEIILLTNDAG